MHHCDMILDFQFGSTGKGLIAGYLAKRIHYDTVVCAFATNAGHTYIDEQRGLHVMTQQLPTGITSPHVKQVLIGPGALIHPETLQGELDRYSKYLEGKRVMIHPHAAIVENYHARQEVEWGLTKMGSTAKGVGAAAIERIKRGPNSNTADRRLPAGMQDMVVSADRYRLAMHEAENLLIEGAQGFSLSMYHGDYPYTTSRDVTPWQIAADCGVPFKWASSINIIGTLRTFPIRVNNRDGSSGPGYSDQMEMTWEQVGVEPELTTVTKLPRRIFSFSNQQLVEAMWHCGHYYHTKLFLNFANYLPPDSVSDLIRQIETVRLPYLLNKPKVEWVGCGPDDVNVMSRGEWDRFIEYSQSTEGATPD